MKQDLFGPTKAKKKAIVYSKACTTKAVFREEIDLNHVSLVATISLLGQRLKTLDLIMNTIAIKDPDLRMMSSNLALIEARKRSQNGHFMKFYVREILAPYCEHLRNAMHDPALPVFLIMNNYSFHNERELPAPYKQCNIQVIWLPAHSSHFLQPLDFGLLGELKGRYQRSTRELASLQWQSKIPRIERAWHGSTYVLNVWNSWAAQPIRLSTSAILRWQADRAKIKEKITNTGNGKNPLR
jgi:hypothetical protein